MNMKVTPWKSRLCAWTDHAWLGQVRPQAGKATRKIMPKKGKLVGTEVSGEW
jgi:hypothetical protein